MDIDNKNKTDETHEKNKAHSLYVLKLETKLHNLGLREEAATRRMQLLVYPAAVAFMVLSAYGFYLVSTLTKDVSLMADSVEIMSQSINKNMSTVANDTSNMSHHMDGLVTNMEGMNTNVINLASTTDSMSQSVEKMSLYTGHIQQDLWSLNKNISKPLSMFNTFIAWHNDTRYPYPSYSLVPTTPTPLVQQPFIQPSSLSDVAVISPIDE